MLKCKSGKKSTLAKMPNDFFLSEAVHNLIVLAHWKTCIFPAGGVLTPRQGFDPQLHCPRYLAAEDEFHLSPNQSFSLKNIFIIFIQFLKKYLRRYVWLGFFIFVNYFQFRLRFFTFVIYSYFAIQRLANQLIFSLVS